MISWILPIYNEEENIPRLIKTLFKLKDALKSKFNTEFVFINDGSSDNSLQILKEYYSVNNDVKIIDFSRNFGHQVAITAGLDKAKGDALIFMDTDLQDPPEISLELVKEWENGVDVVYAKRRSRKDSLLKKLTAFIFYRILKKTSEFEIPTDTGDFRLISRRVADILKTFPEKHRFIRGLVSYIGFSQKAVLFDRNERNAGETGYSIRKMFKLAADAFTGFSLAPIRFVGTVGVSFSLISVPLLIAGIYFLNNYMFLISAFAFFSGTILIAMSIIGQYIGRTYQETQQRPLYIVRSFYNHEEEK